MRWRLALLALCATAATAATARADLVDQFAAMSRLERAQVHEVWGYELPRGSRFTHVLIGRYTRPAAPEQRQTRVMLLRCDARQCTGYLQSLQPTDQLDVLGLIDLEGEPGPLPETAVERRAGSYQRLASSRAPRLRWPALVIRHGESHRATAGSRYGGEVTGTSTWTRISVLSLTAREHAVVFSEDVLRRSANGAGIESSLRLERGPPPKRGRRALDLIVREQWRPEHRSACLPPKPTETRWRLDGDRYAPAAPAGGARSRGC